MKIVVNGGNGLIGSKLVRELRESGRDPVAASHLGVDTVTGEGLPRALRGAQVLVDVCNADWDDDTMMDFYQVSTRNLLAAETTAGVGHHVALSVVGLDRLPESAYFRAQGTPPAGFRAGHGDGVRVGAGDAGRSGFSFCA